MDFHAVLDYVGTAGYDVEFLHEGTPDLLAANPIATEEGQEQFDPRSAPRGALAAKGPYAARLVQGGGTFIDELAGGKTWSGSLDLPASARRVSEMVYKWMKAEVSGEANLISSAGDTFPVGPTAAEQFYSLRDAIHYSEQWLPGSPSSRPALTLLLAFRMGVDEFFCPLESLSSVVYLGRRVDELWEDCLAECAGREDAAQWLALARGALRSSVFLQNREKLAHLELIVDDKDVFTDWDKTEYYMLRSEAAMTPFVGFCLSAYAGLPFRSDLTGAVGLYAYANAFVLDFCKRSTRLGGGNFTEIALKTDSGELQGRSHLIGSLMSYGEATLPTVYLCVLRPFVMGTSSVVDVLDRYRERSWGQRLPVNQATLLMMKAVMEGAGGSLGDSPPQPGLSQCTQLVAEVVEATDAWDAYNSYVIQPSVEAFYKLPRSVRATIQLEKLEHRKPSLANQLLSTPVSWMEFLSKAHSPPLPTPPKLTRWPAVSPTTRFPPIREIESTGLDAMSVRSPARPGGYAAGHRDFIGRPAGAAPKRA